MAQSYNNFLMVGTQRTGSSALAEAINTHPQISCGWEWTERTAFLSKLSAMEDGLRGNFKHLEPRTRDHIESSMGSETRWLGFRRLFGASNKWVMSPRFSLKLLSDRFDAHRRWIRSHPELRLIHIVRTNDVAWLKSKFVAKDQKSYVGSEYPEDLKVQIPISEAKARVTAKHWLDEQLAALATSNPYLRVDYESMASDLPAEAQRIASFLDCDPAALALENTIIKKQSTRSDKDYIANYDELCSALKQ